MQIFHLPVVELEDLKMVHIKMVSLEVQVEVVLYMVVLVEQETHQLHLRVKEIVVEMVRVLVVLPEVVEEQLGLELMVVVQAQVQLLVLVEMEQQIQLQELQ